MKILIIDDDSNAIDMLANKLNNYDDIEIIGTANTGEEGMQIAKINEPEAIFLDVELPDISGLSLLEQMNSFLKGWCQVVMYTGHDSYMLSAFRNNAFDFLMKPIDDIELDNVIQRLYTTKRNNAAMAGSGIVTRSNDDKLLFYTNTSDFRLVHVQDIGLFQYNHDLRVWEVVVACRKEPIKLKRNANNETLLAIDPRFIQVSQKFIININYLLEVKDKMCKLFPPFDKVDYVKVGRLFKKKLIERFNTL